MLYRSIFNVNARNYSIYTIPAAWILTQAVSTRIILLARGLGSNTYPREDLTRVTAQLPPSEAAKIKRQEAAHKNGLENFPLFAAAIIVGNEAGLDSGTLNLIGMGYLITRGVYTWLYTNISTEKKSYLRYVVTVEIRN
jgi:uncharacterized MAPEG superfamily protein